MWLLINILSSVNIVDAKAHECDYLGSGPPIEADDCDFDKAAKKWMFNANSGECFSIITCTGTGFGTKELCKEKCEDLRVMIQGGKATKAPIKEHATTHAPKKVEETTTTTTTSTTQRTTTTVEATTVRAPPAEKESWKSEYESRVETSAEVKAFLAEEEDELKKKRCRYAPEIKLGILHTDYTAIAQCTDKEAGARCPLTCKKGYQSNREQPWSDFLCVDGEWMQYAECVEISQESGDSSLRTILIFLLGGTFILVMIALVGHLLFDVGNPILPSDLGPRRSQARSFVDAAAQKMGSGNNNQPSRSYSSNNNMMEEGLSGAAMRASVGSHHHPRIRSRNNQY